MEALLSTARSLLVMPEHDPAFPGLRFLEWIFRENDKIMGMRKH
jgi:hypothetical protein